MFKAVQNWHTIPEGTVTELLKYEIANDSDSEQVCQLFNFLTTNFDKAENWKFYLDYCQKNCPEQFSSVLWKCRKSLSEAQIANLF